MQNTIIGAYTVEVFQEAYSQLEGVDNGWNYDFCYIENANYRPTTTIGVKIYLNNTIFKSAIIGSVGGGTGIHATSCIYESDRVLICCSDSVFCLSVPDLSLVWKTKADLATCFEIFNYKDDYIVHGELEITRLSNDGKIIWQQGGRDIFTRLNSTRDDFKLAEDYILATDWDNNKYKFSFDGDLI